MRAVHKNRFHSRLLQSVAVIVVTTASVSVAKAQTQTIATPLNVNAINLLMPFTTLLGTETINQNLPVAIGINNNSTTAQRAQAIIDNTITTDNGVVLSDALGSRMAQIWNANNSQASNGTTVTFSTNLQQLFRQINAISQDDSGKSKNFLADGSANGSQFINNGNLALGKTATSNSPITNVSLPANGIFNVYDLAYNPPAATRNLTGDSRPIQVSPGSIVSFSAPNYFGVVQSNTGIAGGVNGNVGTGLFANAAAPSGHTTFGYTTSLLFAMIVPERYQQFMTRASEYGDSRVVLGVHYPLDVMLGRVLGTYDVVQMLNNNPQYTNATVNGVFGIGTVTTTGNFQTLFTAAQADVRNLLQTGCGTSIAVCSATSAPDRFSNAQQNQADYISRLTYGLPTLSFAQAPREAAPAGGPDASILLATLYGGSTAAAQTIAPTGGIYGSLQTSTINQIIVNTETNALAAFYGTPFSYWSRIDLYSAAGYFQNVIGVLALASTDKVATDVSVGNGGTFGGAGLVQGNTTVNSGGTLAPTASSAPGIIGGPGTLTIQGNLQFNPGSAYAVQLAPGATSLTNVTGTTAIASGVQASANFAPGIYTIGGRVPALTTAANGLSGQFSSITYNSTGVNVRPVLSYDAQDAFLSFAQANIAAPLGTPGNGLSVANALNAVINGGATLPASFQNLYLLTPAALASTLNQMASQTGTAAAQSAFKSMNSFLGTIFDFAGPGDAGWAVGAGMQTRTALRFAPEQEAPPEVARAYAAVTPKDRIYTKAPPAPVWIEPSWSFWGSGFGGVAKLDGDAAVGSQDVTSRIAGGAAGADYRLWPNTKIGFALAGGETSFTLANGYGSGHSDFFQGSVYGKSYFGPAYVTGAVAGGAQWVKNDRTVIIGPVFDTLTASYTLPVVAGRLESGYRWFSTPYFGVTPYAAVQAQTAFLPGFTETPTAGTGATANVVASRDVTAVRSELGAWFDTQLWWATPYGVLLRARAAWVHEYERNATVSAQFATLPGSTFLTTGAQLPANAALVSGVVEVPLTPYVTVSGKFDGEFGNGATTWAGTGKVRWVW